MRTSWMIAIVFFILLAGVITAVYFINDSSQQLLYHLASLEEQLLKSDTESLDSSLQELLTAWSASKTWWAVFLEHESLENVSLRLAQLDIDASQGNVASAIKEIAALRVLLQNIAEGELPKWYNIL